jgi:hypothetical protein
LTEIILFLEMLKEKNHKFYKNEKPLEIIFSFLKWDLSNFEYPISKLIGGGVIHSHNTRLNLVTPPPFSHGGGAL